VPARRALRRYLLISPAFPPMSRIGARRALHLCRNLPHFGWEPVVLAAPPRDNHVDPRLAESLPPDMVVSHGYSGVLRSLVHRLARFRPLPFEETPVHGQRRLRERRVLGQDLGFLTPFDQYFYDTLGAVRRGIALVRRHDLEAIQVSADPWSALLAGYAIHRLTGLPLVPDLRDPWSLHEAKMALRPRPTRAIVRHVEHAVFRRSARIVLNTDAACDAYRVAYRGRIPPSRFTFVRNAYDAGLFDPAPPASSSAFRVLYFGRFSRFVEPDILLRAFRRFVAREALAPHEARLTFAGGLRQPDLASIREHGLAEHVDVLGYVPYHDSLALLRSAHVLCLVAGPARTLQIPGKLYDYLAARRPILAISANAELNRILAESGAGTSTPYDDGAQAAAQLGRLFRRFQRGESFDLELSAIAPYAAREQARALASVLDEATA
jgi:glycosyltransferase involved in cell wall biosynthesis